MSKKLILDLCGGTGSWSKPYRDAGYLVEVIDLPNDIRLLKYTHREVHGILAAPPCTEFSFAKHYHGKGNYTHNFKEGVSIVDACLRLVAIYRPNWWALENPKGYLRNYLGSPKVSFDPWQYGDLYQKRTDLWGNFNIPIPIVFNKVGTIKFSLLKSKDIAPEFYHKLSRQVRRSITPKGFANAFFRSNP